ncbi:MAG: MaoC family dehydratase [Solirubrobacteraceae bacterium]
MDARTAARTVAVMLTTTPLDQLASRAGTVLGASDYVTITQDTVDAFAEVTGDRQWIHTDPARAAVSTFRGTIAHGYLTLALAPALLDQVLPLEEFAMVVNYGLDRLRFPAPLPVGEPVRLRVKLDDVERIPGGATLHLTLRFESPALDKPVCVAKVLYRVYEQ